MGRATFTRGVSGGQKRPSTSSRGVPSPKSSSGSYLGTKPHGSTRGGSYREGQSNISGSPRRDQHFSGSKQEYRGEDHHTVPQNSIRRSGNYDDPHHSQLFEQSHSDHRYPRDSRIQYDQHTNLSSNSKSSGYDYSQDRYHNQREYRPNETYDRSRDHHLRSSTRATDHRSTPPRESNRSGENSFFQRGSYNNGPGFNQSTTQSSSKRSPPRSSFSVHRNGHSPRRLDERHIRHDYPQGRPRTPPEPSVRVRSPLLRGHPSRPRTPPFHPYSRPRTPHGPRTPTGPQTPQRSDRFHRSSSPQRSRSPHRSELSHRQRSPQRPRSPMRVRSPQRPRTPQRQRSPLRNRSPERYQGLRSLQHQRDIFSPSSHQNSFDSSKPRPLRSKRAQSPGVRSESDAATQGRARQRTSSNRESALKRLGPRMRMTGRLEKNRGTTRSIGKQTKSERNESARGPLLTLKCPYCEISVKSFRDYRQHEDSNEHDIAVKKAVEELEENIKKLRAKQLEVVESNKPLHDASDEQEKSSGEFCKDCQVSHYQKMSDHESGALHKSIVDALYPECTLCNEKFDSVLDFGRHAAVFYHVKKKASLSQDTLSRDGNDNDEGKFYLLDESGNMDSESERAQLEESGDQDQIDLDQGNFESERKVSESLDDEKPIEIKRTRKSANVKPVIDEPRKEPVGKNHVHKVEMYFCELCHKYLPRGHGDFKELINTHCISKLHMEKYEKSMAQQQKEDNKEATLGSEEISKDLAGASVPPVEPEGVPIQPAEEVKNQYERTTEQLAEDQDDDTLIIDNDQTNIL